MLERLKIFLQSKNIKRTQLTKDFDLQYRTVQRYFSGASDIPLPLLTSIIHRYNINPTWLLLGTGDMLLTPQHTSASALGNIKIDMKRLKKIIAATNETIKTMNVSYKESDKIWLIMFFYAYTDTTPLTTKQLEALLLHEIRLHTK